MALSASMDAYTLKGKNLWQENTVVAVVAFAVVIVIIGFVYKSISRITHRCDHHSISDSDFNVNKKWRKCYSIIAFNGRIYKKKRQQNATTSLSTVRRRFGAIEIIEWWPSIARYNTNIFGDFMMLRYTESAFERPPGDQLLEVTDLLFCCFSVLPLAVVEVL